MTFDIRMGVPDMASFYNDLDERASEGELDEEEKRLFKDLRKTLRHLSNNPRHPGLQSHEIDQLTDAYGQKVFQSYLNQGKTADRIFWTYGPGRREITVLGIAPHPESKKSGAYERVRLSQMPEAEE